MTQVDTVFETYSFVESSSFFQKQRNQLKVLSVSHSIFMNFGKPKALEPE